MRATVHRADHVIEAAAAMALAKINGWLHSRSIWAEDHDQLTWIALNHVSQVAKFDFENGSVRSQPFDDADLMAYYLHEIDELQTNAAIDRLLYSD